MPESQAQYEQELLAWTSKLDESHMATLRQLAAGPPAEFMRQLAATGLSRGALQVAAATIDQHGFDGATSVVRERLQEVQVEAAAQDPQMQERAAKWLTDNGLTPEAGKSHVHEVAKIHLAAQAHGVAPAALAQQIARTPNPAEAEAQAAAESAAAAEREKAAKNPALSESRLQRILEHPGLHRAAAALGTTGSALLTKLVKLATSGDFVEAAETSGGLFKDASDARKLLGELGAAVAEDRLAQKASTRDGPAAPEPTEPNEDTQRRADVLASLGKHDRSDPSKQIIEVDSGRKFDVMRTYREHTGQSLNGVRPTARVASEVARDAAKGIREKFHVGDTRRDDIRSSMQQLEAASKGPDELARFEQARRGAVDIADQLDRDATADEERA